MIKADGYILTRIDDKTALVTITMNKSLFYFRGHFDVQPILPGVVQLGWVYEYSHEIFGIYAKTHIPRIKFRARCSPGEWVTLEINHEPQKKFFNFTYRFQDGREASKGKIKY